MSADAARPVTVERDYVLQMEWAYQDFKNLVDAAKQWIEREGQHCRLDPDPQDSRFVVVRATAKHPPAEPFVRLTTSCIHGMRATLDLLAYALAEAYARERGVPLDLDDAADSEFPILGRVSRKGNPVTWESAFGKPDSWGNKAIRGVDPAAQAHIKALQPYHKGADFRDDPLWQLNVLDNHAKHRLHHPIKAVGGGNRGSLTLDYSRSVPVRLPYGGVLSIPAVTVVEQDTVLARLSADVADAFAEMQMQYRAALRVGFDKGVPEVELQPVTDVLARIFNHIQHQVFPQLEPFLT